MPPQANSTVWVLPVATPRPRRTARTTGPSRSQAAGRGRGAPAPLAKGRTQLGDEGGSQLEHGVPSTPSPSPSPAGCSVAGTLPGLQNGRGERRRRGGAGPEAEGHPRGVLRHARRPGRAHRLDLHPASDPRAGLRSQLRPGRHGPRRPQRRHGPARAAFGDALGAIRTAPPARVRAALRRNRLPHRVDGERLHRACPRAVHRGLRSRLPARPVLVARKRGVFGSGPPYRARCVQLERRYRQASLHRSSDHPARGRRSVAARRRGRFGWELAILPFIGRTRRAERIGGSGIGTASPRSP